METTTITPFTKLLDDIIERDNLSGVLPFGLVKSARNLLEIFENDSFALNNYKCHVELMPKNFTETYIVISWSCGMNNIQPIFFSSKCDEHEYDVILEVYKSDKTYFVSDDFNVVYEVIKQWFKKK